MSSGSPHKAVTAHRPATKDGLRNGHRQEMNTKSKEVEETIQGSTSDMVGHLKTLARFNINNAGNNRMVLDTMDQNKISSKCAAGEVCNDYRYRSLDGPAVRAPAPPQRVGRSFLVLPNGSAREATHPPVHAMSGDGGRRRVTVRWVRCRVVELPGVGEPPHQRFVAIARPAGPARWIPRTLRSISFVGTDQLSV